MQTKLEQQGETVINILIIGNSKIHLQLLWFAIIIFFSMWADPEATTRLQRRDQTVCVGIFIIIILILESCSS